MVHVCPESSETCKELNPKVLVLAAKAYNFSGFACVVAIAIRTPFDTIRVRFHVSPASFDTYTPVLPLFENEEA